VAISGETWARLPVVIFRKFRRNFRWKLMGISV